MLVLKKTTVDFEAWPIFRFIVSGGVCCLVDKLCLALCDAMACSPPGSSVCGILQARILEWEPCPPPGDLPDPGTEPKSPVLAGGLLTAEPPGKRNFWCRCELLTVVSFKSFTRSHTSLREELYTPHPPDLFLLCLVGRGGWVSRWDGGETDWIGKRMFSSVTQSRPTLCYPMDCSRPVFSVHHQLPELTQTHVHWVSDAIQPSYPLLFPSPPAFNLSQHQGLYQWVSASHQVARVLEFQLQHQPMQWIFRTDFLRMDWLDLPAVQGTLKSLLQHHSSKASILWCSAFFIVQLSHPYMTTGKTIALTRWTFVGKVTSLLFNMLSRLVITFLPRSKYLFSWLQSPCAVILEPRKIKSFTVSIVSPSICHGVMGLDAMNLVFWMLSFKPTSSPSSFTFIKRLFSFLLSAIRVVSSAYLRLLIVPPAILIPACASSSPVFLMMHSAYKLIKQGV